MYKLEWLRSVEYEVSLLRNSRVEARQNLLHFEIQFCSPSCLSPSNFSMSTSTPAYLKPGAVAVVTGAAFGGIGFEIALIALKRHQMKVVLVDQSQAALENTEKALVGAGVAEEQFSSKVIDVSSVQEVQKLADEVYEQHSRVDFLVLNAGTSVSSKSFGGDLEPWT